MGMNFKMTKPQIIKKLCLQRSFACRGPVQHFM